MSKIMLSGGARRGVEDTFYKYPSIPYAFQEDAPHEGLVYEKIDGSNCQIRNLSGTIIAGTRSKPVKEYHRPLPWMKDFQAYALQAESFRALPEKYILYGEWLSNHNLGYPSKRFSKPLVFIDLFDTDVSRFVHYEAAKGILRDERVTEVHFLDTLSDCTAFSQESLETIAKRMYGEIRPFEGVVIKNYAKQQFRKFVLEQVDSILKGFVQEHLKSETRKDFLDKNFLRMLSDKISRSNGRHIHDEILEIYLRRI